MIVDKTLKRWSRWDELYKRFYVHIFLDSVCRFFHQELYRESFSFFSRSRNWNTKFSVGRKLCNDEIWLAVEDEMWIFNRLLQFSFMRVHYSRVKWNVICDLHIYSINDCYVKAKLCEYNCFLGIMIEITK